MLQSLHYQVCTTGNNSSNNNKSYSNTRKVIPDKNSNCRRSKEHSKGKGKYVGKTKLTLFFKTIKAMFYTFQNMHKTKNNDKNNA